MIRRVVVLVLFALVSTGCYAKVIDIGQGPEWFICQTADSSRGPIEGCTPTGVKAH